MGPPFDMLSWFITTKTRDNGGYNLYNSTVLYLDGVINQQTELEGPTLKGFVQQFDVEGPGENPEKPFGT